MTSYIISWKQIVFYLRKLWFQCKSVCDREGEKEGGQLKGGQKEAIAFDVRNPLLLMLFLLIKYPSQYFGTGTKQKHMRKKV